MVNIYCNLWGSSLKKRREGNQVIQREPEIPRNEYQKNLDLGLPTPQLTSESVRYWSDFNRLFYHPKSIFQLNDSEFDSQVRPFDNWSAGEDLFRSLDQEHDIIDSDFRPFIEECDCLGGIQLFSETDDAWGGFAARYVDRLKDEYGKTDIWFWGLENPLCVQQVCIDYIYLTSLLNIETAKTKS